ncbi:HAD family hydrolase [Novipirellula artificiosorum]|uniref:Phosphoglycolate phosphatase n=1 Tax=Novipirellula artificiosorum TaxID=2528016 RepID=A0A5C6DEP8_9BACT|nr:HAD family hydrolase [Novipirellula artificiosorum]TWU33409.1 Phosphoglycolate phosphatase [Novipirellula artificiosorum]
MTSFGDTDRAMDAMISQRHPLQPIPTSIAAKLRPMPEIRSVIFDVYGTLVISGSGDIGTSVESSHPAIQNQNDPASAFSAVGMALNRPAEEIIACMRRLIQETNQQRESESCVKPEVDILDIWRRTLLRFGEPEETLQPRRVLRFAAEYEARANPTWPMPGAAKLLPGLHQRGKRLGIVSNAQVFTPWLVEDLLGMSLDEAGFDLNLCLFSNRFLRAKPDPMLFDHLVQNLDRCGVSPNQAIYVGNDMLNDVYAASAAGLKTAWFVGDKRSCRTRTDDTRCQSLQADLVLTDLQQLLDCL